VRASIGHMLGMIVHNSPRETVCMPLNCFRMLLKRLNETFAFDIELGIVRIGKQYTSGNLHLPPKTHLNLCIVVQCTYEDLIVHTSVVWKVATRMLATRCQSALGSMETYNISVNRNCHGGYPFNCTVGLNKINKSGSLLTWSLNCASTKSWLICSRRTSPLCAISASVRVRSTMVSRPSCSERRSTVRCWRSLCVPLVET